MGGALSREWSLQTYIPDAGSRLPFLPQAILAAFFLLNMATLVFLRQRFILPSEAALEAVSETVAAQGEILPSRAAPGYIAGAVNSLLSRYRLEAEEEKRSIRESAERRTPGDLRIPKESAVAPPAHQEDAPVAPGRRSLRDPPRRGHGRIRVSRVADREGLRRRVPRVPGGNRSRLGKSAPDPAVEPRLPSGADVLVREPVPRIPPGTASSSRGGVDPRFLSRSLPPGDEKPEGALRGGEELRGPDLLQLLFREPEVLVEEYSAGVLHGGRETPRSIAKRSSPVSGAKFSRPPPCWSSGASRTGRW